MCVCVCGGGGAGGTIWLMYVLDNRRAIHPVASVAVLAALVAAAEPAAV